MYLVFNKIEWQLERQTNAFGFRWTDEEIDNAIKSEKGFIGNKFGVDCYVSRLLESTSDREL